MKKLLFATLLLTGATVCAQEISSQNITTDVIPIKLVKEKSTQLSLAPGLSLGAFQEDSISKFSFNILGATNKNVTGLDISILGLREIKGDFKGQHISLIPIDKFTVKGDLYGHSFSLWNDIDGAINGSVFGGLNTVNDVDGGVTGLVNLVAGDVISTVGIINIIGGTANKQFGFFNRAKSVSGVQLGLVNSTKNLDGVQIGLVNHSINGVLPVLPLVNFRKTL